MTMLGGRGVEDGIVVARDIVPSFFRETRADVISWLPTILRLFSQLLNEGPSQDGPSFRTYIPCEGFVRSFVKSFRHTPYLLSIQRHSATLRSAVSLLLIQIEKPLKMLLSLVSNIHPPPCGGCCLFVKFFQHKLEVFSIQR